MKTSSTHRQQSVRSPRGFVVKGVVKHRFHPHLPPSIPRSREIGGIAQNGTGRSAETYSKGKGSTTRSHRSACTEEGGKGEGTYGNRRNRLGIRLQL